MLTRLATGWQKNCGLDIEHYKSEMRKTNVPFFCRRADKIEQIQKTELVRERMLVNGNFR